MVFIYFVSSLFVQHRHDYVPTNKCVDTKSNLNLQVDVEAISALI